MRLIEWMQKFAEDALQNNDQERLQLVYYAQQGDIFRESNPEIAYQIYQLGRTTAERLPEPCWVLYFAQRMAHVCIFELENLDRAMDLVTRDYVLSTKESYIHCPINTAIRLNLVETYLYYDPVGYADTIQEVVDYLYNTETDEAYTRLQLDDFLAQLYLKLNQLDKALEYSLKTLDSGYGYLTLTRIYWERGEYDNALKISEIREEESSASPFLLADARAWVAAMLMRTGGDALRAKSLYDHARYYMNKINFVPNSTLFDALTEYHEAAGNRSDALHMRNEQLSKQNEVAGPEEVVIVRLRRARLLGRMNRTGDLQQQITDIRDRLHQFKNPEHYEKLLQLIEDRYYSDVVWKEL